MLPDMSHEYCFILHLAFGWIFLLIILDLRLLETLKHVVTVMNIMKYVEFGLVIASEKHSANPSLRRGSREEAITVRVPYSHTNEGMLIHLHRSERTELRFRILTPKTVNVFLSTMLGTPTLLLINAVTI